MILKIILGTLVSIVVLYFIFKFLKHRSLYPFLPYKYNFGKRRCTFRKTLQLLSERNARTLVETGTARKGLLASKSDGASTIVFGLWAKQNNATMHSVDISEDSVKNSQHEVNQQNLSDSVKLHLGDSLEFLKNFEDRVDFLYLDSYDYSKKDRDIQIKSQEHHLLEFKNIENKLHKNTVVLIDDCRLPNGGKGKTVIEYMLKKNWLVLINAYQVLLIHKDSQY